jgi:hypothetical protein
MAMAILKAKQVIIVAVEEEIVKVGRSIEVGEVASQEGLGCEGAVVNVKAGWSCKKVVVGGMGQELVTKRQTSSGDLNDGATRHIE